MWEESLIESGSEKKVGKKLLLWPIAGLIHGMVVTVLICGSYWHVEALEGPKALTVFMVPGGLPPGALSDGGLAPPKPPKQNLPEQIVPESHDVGEEVSSPQQIEEPSEGAPGTGTVGGVVGGMGDGSSKGIGDGVGGGDGGGEETGGDQPVIIRADMEKPVLIHKVEPTYPPLALRIHIQGVVQLEAVISKTGDVEGLRIVSSPHPLLSASAMNAVQQWKYRPATLNGKPLSVYFTVTVRFSLR